MPKVEFRLEGPVAIVSIERAEVRNAVDGETADGLRRASDRFEADDALSVAVLTGAGGHFCAGADLSAAGSSLSTRQPDAGEVDWSDPENRDFGGLISLRIYDCLKLELALWCDLRVASESAVFGVFCRRFGVPLVDGGSVRLPRIVGHGVAMDLILTGRGVDSDEAFRIGLANRVVPEGEALLAAVALAQELAVFPQRCLRGDRRSAIEQWGHPVEEALVREGNIGIDVIRSGETVSGARRFVAGEGRHGRFN